LETAITSAFPPRDRPQVVVYADDFVVWHPTRAGVENAQCVAEEWLSGMGLHLKASKTRIGHTLHAIDGHGGIDFLGFSIRHYPTGKTRPGHDGRTPRPYKMRIKPSTAAVRRHLHALRALVRAHKAAPHMALIVQLNPVIRGWTMYYRAVVATRIVASCDDHLVATLKHWAGRRHGHKSVWWVFDTYWRRSATGRLEFATPDGLRLVHHADTPIRRHVNVLGMSLALAGLAFAANIHFVGEPDCDEVNGRVCCEGKLAGVGQAPTNVQILADFTCTNPGGNQPPGQASGETGPIQPRGGQITFNQCTTEAGCPPPQAASFGDTATIQVLQGGAIVFSADVPID
jgi:hypothetical protein